MNDAGKIVEILQSLNIRILIETTYDGDPPHIKFEYNTEIIFDGEAYIDMFPEDPSEIIYQIPE